MSTPSSSQEEWAKIWIAEYSPGSNSRNLAGWAWLDSDGRHHSGGHAVSTNNRAILMAAEDAIQSHEDAAGLVFYTDLQYARQALFTLVPGWETNGWTGSRGEIKNKDRVRSIYEERKKWGDNFIVEYRDSSDPNLVKCKEEAMKCLRLDS